MKARIEKFAANADDEDDSDCSSVSGSSESMSSSSSSNSMSSSTERCPICLTKFKEQDIGKPNNCEHTFCLECLEEWSKNTNTCPIDRKIYNEIIAKHVNSEECFKKIKVEDRQQNNDDNIEYVDDITYCRICSSPDREDQMLLCDGCDDGYHLDCLDPPLAEIPSGQWYCPHCFGDSEAEPEDDATFFVNDSAFNYLEEVSAANIHEGRLRSRSNYRQIARTRFSERIRRRINTTRLRRGATIVVSETDDDDDEETKSSNNEEVKKDEMLELYDELCELGAEATTSRRAVAAKPVVRRSVKKRRTKRRRKTRKRKSSTAQAGKKTKKRRKKKKRLISKRYSRKKKPSTRLSPGQDRIKTVLRSYQSLPKNVEERLEEKRRVDSGIKVFKTFTPTLDSEFYDAEVASDSQKESQEKVKPSSQNIDILASILESQKRLFSDWENHVRLRRNSSMSSISSATTVQTSVLERLLPSKKLATNQTGFTKACSEESTSSSVKSQADGVKAIHSKTAVVVISPIKVPNGIKVKPELMKKIEFPKQVSIQHNNKELKTQQDSSNVNIKINDKASTSNKVGETSAAGSQENAGQKRKSRSPSNGHHSRSRHRSRDRRSRSPKRRHCRSRSKEHKRKYESKNDSVIEITPVKHDSKNESVIMIDPQDDAQKLQSIVQSIYGDKSMFEDSFDCKDKSKSELQDEIVKTAKEAIKPYYIKKKIDKDEYKLIMKKVVNKCLIESKNTRRADSNRIKKMIIAYVDKTRSERHRSS